MALCTQYDICSTGKVKSGEGYPNRHASFGLNRGYKEMQTPNWRCTDQTEYFEHFYNFLRFIVKLITGHF